MSTCLKQKVRPNLFCKQAKFWVLKANVWRWLVKDRNESLVAFEGNQEKQEMFDLSTQTANSPCRQRHDNWTRWTVRLYLEITRFLAKKLLVGRGQSVTNKRKKCNRKNYKYITTIKETRKQTSHRCNEDSRPSRWEVIKFAPPKRIFFLFSRNIENGWKNTKEMPILQQRLLNIH